MQLKDILTRRVEPVSPGTVVREAARKLLAQNLSALPVCDGGRLVGAVSARDLIVRAAPRGGDPSSQPVREVMNHDPPCCYADQEVGAAAEYMAARQLGQVLVVDHDQRLVGVLWLRDVMTFYDLEEAGVDDDNDRSPAASGGAPGKRQADHSRHS